MKKILLSPPHLTNFEMEFIEKAFASNWIAPIGENVSGFEEDIRDFINIKYAVALSSGTAAIHLALIVLGVCKWDEVICSDFTFAASANPICYLGAIPIFVDSEINTWNMCPIALDEAIKDRISKGKKPKAIILVHTYGMPSKMDEIMKVSVNYDIPVIEDAAEALGSKYNGKHLGTFGSIGIFSFNGNKIITTSGGGALVTNNAKYYEKTKFLSSQAKDPAIHYQHSEIGYNYRMSNILAGLGRGQIKFLQDKVDSRRENYHSYRDKLSGNSIEFLDELKYSYSNRWLTCILFDSLETRERLRLSLINKNIEARPLWKPMHMQPVFKENPRYITNISEDLFTRGLCLPSGSNLSIQEINKVVKTIKENI